MTQFLITLLSSGFHNVFTSFISFSWTTVPLTPTHPPSPSTLFFCFRFPVGQVRCLSDTSIRRFLLDRSGVCPTRVSGGFCWTGPVSVRQEYPEVSVGQVRCLSDRSIRKRVKFPRDFPLWSRRHVYFRKSTKLQFKENSYLWAEYVLKL